MPVFARIVIFFFFHLFFCARVEFLFFSFYFASLLG